MSALQRGARGLVAVAVAAVTTMNEGLMALGFGAFLVGGLLLAFVGVLGGVTHPPWVRYAVTDRRMLVVGSTVESLRFEELSSIDLEPACGPAGTVRAWRRTVLPQDPHLRFDVVDDAQRVVRLVRAARARLRR